MTQVTTAAPASGEPRGSEETIDVYAAIHIRKRADGLVGCVGLSKCDREDLQQDMATDLLRRLSRYSPTQAKRTTFTTLVVDHRACTIVEQRSAQKRDHTRCQCSLNEMIDDGQGSRVERSQTISCEINHSGRPHEQLHRLGMDLKTVLASLDDDQRWFCQQLMAGKSVARIARESRHSRHHLRQMRQALRQAFTAAGLDAYL